MTWDERVRFWNLTEAERGGRHPADDHVTPGGEHYVRAIDVDAESMTVYRWLCQIRLAPYSYDLIDNLGRRSPPTLTPGADRLRLGQRFQIGPLVDFEEGRQITFVSAGFAARAFGQIAMSYQVVPGVHERSRILACVALGPARRRQRPWRTFLAIGDLVMMRKQLRTLKRYAELTDGA